MWKILGLNLHQNAVCLLWSSLPLIFIYAFTVAWLSRACNLFMLIFNDCSRRRVQLQKYSADFKELGQQVEMLNLTNEEASSRETNISGKMSSNHSLLAASPWSDILYASQQRYWKQDNGNAFSDLKSCHSCISEKKFMQTGSFRGSFRVTFHKFKCILIWKLRV